MKDYFKRNSPIFYIGVITAVVFFAIIIAGQSQPNIQPSLKPLEEKDLFSNNDNIIGFKDARVTVVEFMDYSCPFCKTINQTNQNLLSGNKNKVRFVIRNFPLKELPGHENSYSAALAAQASAKFGKFEEMHNSLLEAQDLSKEAILTIAEKLGINKEDFIKEWNSEAVKNKVDKDLVDAQNLQLSGTPTYFINGKRLDLQNNDLSTTTISEINRIYPQN